MAHCGCCYFHNNSLQYLPQVSLQAHASILPSAARTTLTQIFGNPSNRVLEKVSYTFPLYDGVSVVGFKCDVGGRILHSQVKTREQANTDYLNAVSQHETAAILDHSTTENDVFKIRLGNVPAKEKVTVQITFVAELKQDSQTDGIRYTLPNAIAPRYGNAMHFSPNTIQSALPANLQGISLTADVVMYEGSAIRELESPSHSVKVTLGRTSTTPESSAFEPSKASASLHLDRGNVLLERDFVMVVKADGLDTPRALMESHPTMPSQRALMATLVPKFSLPPAKPELIFVIDRSGSMYDKTATLRSALEIFLKSLPVGICFNICSFGNRYSLLWPKSRVYNASSLEAALDFVNTIDANMGGTKMLPAVEAAVKSRLNDKNLEVLLLTDGQIMNQESLFQFVRDTSASHTARFFSLAIGDAASHSLVEGVARAGNGFSQSVLNYEELDRKIIRMLKGALTPHIYDYKLELNYDTNPDAGFEFVSHGDDQSSVTVTEDDHDHTFAPDPETQTSQQPISLFSENFKEPDMNFGLGEHGTGNENLPEITTAAFIQAPYKIPTLYPFIRTTVYLLMDPSSQRVPQSLKFQATSEQGPLELQIPISDIGKGETIHQLAARKAVTELEEEHGWLIDAKDNTGNSFSKFHPGTKHRLAVRECQHLGIKFQVTGKHCSFVALEEQSSDDLSQKGKPAQTKEFEVEQLPAQASCSAPMAYGSSFVGSVAARRSVYAPPGRSLLPDGSIRASAGQASPPMFQYSQRRARIDSLASESPSHGAFGSSHVQVQADSLCEVANEESQMPSARDSLFGSLFGGASSGRGASGPLMQPSSASPAASSASPNNPSNKIHMIIAMQGFDGCWKWSSELFGLLEIDEEETKKKLSNLFLFYDSSRAETVLATLLVMGFLANKNLQSNSAYELVYDKADAWVTSQLAELGEFGQSVGRQKADVMNLV